MKQHQLNNFLRMFMLPCVIFLFTLLPNVAQAANANDVDIKLKWGMMLIIHGKPIRQDLK